MDKLELLQPTDEALQYAVISANSCIITQGHVCFMSPSDSFYLHGFPCLLPSKPSSPHSLKGNSGTARCKESIPVAPLRMESPAALSSLYLFFSAQSPQLIRMPSFSFSALIASAATSKLLPFLYMHFGCIVLHVYEIAT